jgi:pyruvate/2-oxoglutarate dehydrogenase complex dihydrolipoamide dehydrogenase (E3) component/uncharacterized membrane protein YdjX (TVP38/TMEM64 family)
MAPKNLQKKQMTHYDALVMGAGSGGLTASIGLAKAGKKVLLIERDTIGGDCTNTGCVPSKALIHQAGIARKLVRENASAAKVSSRALDATRTTIQKFLQEETPEKIAAHGVTVVLGNAQFIDAHTVSVGGTSYTAKKIIISSGAHPRPLSVPGIENANVHTSDSIFTLKEIPKRLLVIGSGPIGLELGQAFSRLGAAVTIASIDAEIGRLEEPAVAAELQAQFEKENIKFIGNAYLKEFSNKNTAVFEIKEGEKVVETLSVAHDTMLVSIGRIPNIDMNLDAAGIEYSPRGITIDKKYRTNQKHIYAIGDVSDSLKFTHTADDAARNIIKQILLPFPMLAVKRIVPKVTYTSPELAQVGLSYAAATKKYGEEEIMKITVPFSSLVDRAKVDETSGVLVVIAKRLTGRILGAHMAADRAGDMLSFFTLAMHNKNSMWKLNKIIYPYPSYSLAIKKASDLFLSETLRTVKADIWYIIRKHITKIFALIFWAALLYAFHTYKEMHGMDTRELSIALANFITGTFWGPVVYMLFYIFRPLILFPAVLLTTLSGIMFGFWGGFIYTFIGENISASFVYLIGRFFGSGIRFEDTPLGGMIGKIKESPFISILLARFLFFPFDLTNLACGAIKARWRSYALATAIGIIPGMSTFIALGASLENVAEFDLSMLHINPMTLIASAALFIFSLVLARVLKKYKS